MNKTSVAIFVSGFMSGSLLAGFGVASHDAGKNAHILKNTRDIASQLDALREQLALQQPVQVLTDGNSTKSGLMTHRLSEESIQQIVASVSSEITKSLDTNLLLQTEKYPASSAENISNENRQIIRSRMEQTMEPVNQVLDIAIEQGIWGENEARAFTESLRDLPDEARAEAHRKLAAAINSEQLRVEVDTLPLF